MKIEFDAPVGLQEQIEKVVISATKKVMEINQKKLAANEWMSLKEGAAYANVSYGSFIKFRTLGLKVVEIDSIKRVSKTEIDRFLNENSF